MLGFLNQESLSAVSLATQIQFVLNLFYAALTIGTTVLAAQYWGKRDVVSVEKVLAIAVRISMLVSSVFFFAACFLPGLLMRIFTGEEFLISLGIPYLRLVSWSYLCTGISQIYLCIMKNSGRSMRSTIYGTVSVVLNIILNAVFIFGLLGFSKMEIEGAALATVIARAVELILVILENMKEEEEMNNIERRDLGMPYISDESVMEEQKRCRKILQRLNTADRSDFDEIGRIVKELFGKSEGAFLNPPFYCDYGSHIEVGKNFFANYNCTIIDVAKVRIGDNCQMAPNVAIYTAGHPVHPVSRNSMYEYGIEVSIGDNVWIGGNTVILPGVRIGSNTVIGAGSVVTKDIPDWVIAAGNPCKVIRKITDADKKFYFRQRQFDEEAWNVIENIGKREDEQSHD